MNKQMSLVLISVVLCSNAFAQDRFLYSPIRDDTTLTCHFCGYTFKSGACHGGIDFDTTDSTTNIYAAASGVVGQVIDEEEVTCKDIPYGNHVKINHSNGYQTIYAHLKEGTVKVKQGDEVSTGQLLGVGDSTGCVQGSHLHFEVRDPSGNRVDPYDAPENHHLCIPDLIPETCGLKHLWLTCPPTPWEEEDPLKRDDDGDGFSEDGGDCDDTDKHTYPGAPELCNSIDDDCDDEIDEEPDASYHCRDQIDCTENYCEQGMCRARYHHDACPFEDECLMGFCTINGCRSIDKDKDNDGHVDADCGGDDCDDDNKNTYPGAPEICDDSDNNCNGILNEGINITNDVNNCGKCDNKCPQGDNTVASCENSQCYLKCAPTWVDTDNNLENGCELQVPRSRGETCESDEECESGLSCFEDSRADFDQKICTIYCSAKSECHACEVCMNGCTPGIGAHSESLPTNCPCIEHDSGNKDCGYGMWCGDPDNDGYPTMDCYSYYGGCVCSHF